MKKIFINIVILISFCCLPGCGCDTSSGGDMTYDRWKIRYPSGTWEQYRTAYKGYWGGFPDSSLSNNSKFKLEENHGNLVINFFNPFDRKTITTIILDENHEIKILVK